MLGHTQQITAVFKIDGEAAVGLHTYIHTSLYIYIYVCININNHSHACAHICTHT